VLVAGSSAVFVSRRPGNHSLPALSLYDLLRAARPSGTPTGAEFSAGTIRRTRRRPALRWGRAADVAARAAHLIAGGGIVGWFQGRMEMGPRALGARSILASPASVAIRDRINAQVKGREPFRPFAPSVLAEEADAFFDIPEPTAAPYDPHLRRHRACAGARGVVRGWFG
jgi:predicted NodU family carbamoyl transferase